MQLPCVNKLIEHAIRSAGFHYVPTADVPTTERDWRHVAFDADSVVIRNAINHIKIPKISPMEIVINFGACTGLVKKVC